MSEEQKKPDIPEEETAEEPVEQTASGTKAPDTEEEAPAGEKKAEKRKKDAGKKEKTYTLTHEQMEAAEKAAKQLESVTDRFTRLAAEYDNYRKRTAREKETAYQDAKIDAIKPMLDVYDNLERAATQEGDDDNAHKKGMVMIFHQLTAVLEKLGVTILDPKGEPFDPAKHDAVMHVDDESLGENVVAQVFRKGFMLGDKVIRFASVQVAN